MKTADFDSFVAGMLAMAEGRPMRPRAEATSGAMASPSAPPRE